jgi:hypothetical protein
MLDRCLKDRVHLNAECSDGRDNPESIVCPRPGRQAQSRKHGAACEDGQRRAGGGFAACIRVLSRFVEFYRLGLVRPGHSLANNSSLTGVFDDYHDVDVREY